MGFAAGMAAGAAAVDRAFDISQRRKQQQRADEEYQRQKDARDSYHQLQQDYYTGQGQFAGTPAQGPDTATADASYGRLENQRMGLQTPDVAQAPMPDSQGAMQPRGLSMTPQQAQGAPAQPMPQADKDKLYYTKLSQWADTHLDPDKAVAFQNDVARLQETNYQQKRLTAFRQLSSGDRQGLDNILQLSQENGMVPKGAKVDTTQAVFDPQKGWQGIQVTTPDGQNKTVNLDHDTMIGMFMNSDPAQMLKYRMAQAEEARANRGEARADKRIALEERGENRADRLATSTIAKNDASIRQGDAELELKKRANAIAAGHLGIAQQELGLRKSEQGLREKEYGLREQEFQSGEKAKEGQQRIQSFMTLYGVGKAPDPNSMTYEQDKKAYDDRLDKASTAYAAYQMNAQDLKSADERNKVQAAVQNFFNAAKTGKIDPSKATQNEDGSYTYQGLRLPANVFGNGPAAAPEKGARAPLASRPAQGMRGLTPPSFGNLPDMTGGQPADAAALQDNPTLGRRLFGR